MPGWVRMPKAQSRNWTVYVVGQGRYGGNRELNVVQAATEEAMVLQIVAYCKRLKSATNSQGQRQYHRVQRVEMSISQDSNRKYYMCRSVPSSAC